MFPLCVINGRHYIRYYFGSVACHFAIYAIDTRHLFEYSSLFRFVFMRDFTRKTIHSSNSRDEEKLIEKCEHRYSGVQSKISVQKNFLSVRFLILSVTKPLYTSKNSLSRFERSRLTVICFN